MPTETGAPSDKEQALWMLDRIAKSEEALAALRAAKPGNRAEEALQQALADPHQQTVAKLYRAKEGETVELPSDLAATMVALADRDLLSGGEELIEKALAAYIASHPKGAEGLPQDWQTTLSSARAEIEGQTKGNFEPEFAGRLADAARVQQAIKAHHEQREREERDNKDRGRGR